MKNLIVLFFTIALFSACSENNSIRGKILTVRGPINPDELGATLPHEHVMVDFIGADKTGPQRYDPDEVYNRFYGMYTDVSGPGS